VGTDTISTGSVVLIKDHRVNFLSGQPTPTSIVGDTISWQYSNFKALDTLVFHFNINYPISVHRDDWIRYISTVYPTINDLRPGDNRFTLYHIVTGSFDPNDKRESHGNFYTTEDLASDEFLYYTVRFQNTGNDTALNVTLRDTLDSRLDWNSLEMIGGSHSYSLSIKDGNKVEWKFPNIKLVDSNRNEAGSHGYITYRVKPRSILQAGDTIRNDASIYFDFNPPVETNSCITIIRLPTPPQPSVSGIQDNYCSNQGIQKGKINNLPSPTSGTTATVKLEGNNLPIAADSTFAFDVSALSAGSHQLKVIYSNSTASDSLSKIFAVNAASTPDVNLSSTVTNIINLTTPVIVTATNAAGGGSTPLYTFASDRNFNIILQAEGNNNVLNITPANLLVGDNWIYVRMKTSLTCYAVQINIDSILLKRDAVTGIIDVNDPGRVINIYPNPFNKHINISGLNPTKSYEITFVDLNGKQLLKKQIQNSSQFNLPVRNYFSGMYILNLYDKKTQRLIGRIRILKQ